MPTAESFWDRVAPKYAKDPIKDVPAYEATLERVRAYLNPTDTVLELGCGTGTTALKLAASARHILATDISGKMIEIATEKAWDAGTKNVTFKQSPADARHDQGPFDAVMAFNVIHLLPDMDQAIRDMAANIRPGGLLIVKTPCLREYSIFIRMLIPVMQLVGYAPFVAMFTPDDMDASVRAAGLSIEETGFYPVKARSRFIVARKANT